MKKIIIGNVVSLLALVTATPSVAGTLKLPQCLAYPSINGSVPCTGIVPVDTVNGNPITWPSLFANGTLGTVAPVTGNLVGAKDASGNLQALTVGVNGALNVNVLSGGGSGGSGGATTIADGADIAEGATTDVATTIGGVGSISAKLRRISTQLDSLLAAPLATGTNAIGSITNTTFGATQSGTWNVGTVASITNPVTVTGTFFQATQAVSAVSLPLPTNASTAANQATANTSLATIVTNLGAPFQAGGSIANTAFGAKLQDATGVAFGTSGNPIFVSDSGGSSTPTGSAGTPNVAVLSIQGIGGGTAIPVTGAFFQATQPVSLAVLPALATGANIIGSIANTGFAATQSGAWNITNITGTVSLPTGASTATNQATANSSLATIATNTTGLATAAGQTTAATSLATIATNTTSLATSTNQVAANASLATIATNTSAATAAGEAHIGEVSTHGFSFQAAAFNRPADTNAYVLGDVIGPSTVAASMVPISLPVARVNGGTVRISSIRFWTSSTNLTNAQFRIHIYASAPTFTNGDNGAWLTSGYVSGIPIYCGSLDVVVNKAFADGAEGEGYATTGSNVTCKAATGSSTLYAIPEARSGYVPTNAEGFELTISGDTD